MVAPRCVQFRPRRIGDENLHQESIQLRFRQRVRALHFGGFLGGHDQEWRFQRVGCVAAGHRPFLHGFEQRGLGFGGGAVDFVGEHQVGEDGPD